MTYPEYANIKGVKYKINTDFRVALRCFQLLDDDEITDEERAYATIYMLFGFVPEEDADLFLDKCKFYLQCGQTEKQQSSKEKDLDFFQDDKYIMASFMSDYQIDLSKEKLHWWQYVELIEGLTPNAVLSKIREIRNYDISQVKDTKERQKIINAKNSVALKEKKTKKQLEDDEFFEKLLKGGV